MQVLEVLIKFPLRPYLQSFITSPPILQYYHNNQMKHSLITPQLQPNFSVTSKLLLRNHIIYTFILHHMTTFTHRKFLLRPTDTDSMYGLNIIACPKRRLPILLHCKPGTSAMRIPRWRSELRNAYITSINDTVVNSMADVRHIFQQIRTNKDKEVKISFSTIEKQAMHPQLGIPQLYQDQLNIIGQH